MIAQFTEHTSAIKISGHAKIYTAVGEVESHSKKSSVDHKYCLPFILLVPIMTTERCLKKA